MIRHLALGAIVLLITVQTACVPRTREDSRTVGARPDPAEVEPPVLPEGVVAPELMAEAIEFDLTHRPDGQNYWSLGDSEADCAATGIVDAIGSDRLVDLGYKPGTPGAGLPQIDLTAAERDQIVAQLVDCTDQKEMAAALLFGNGRIPARSATCMGEILAKAGVPTTWLAAWIFDEPVDPFVDDADASTNMSAAARVCLDPASLNWPALRSPIQESPVIDADAPAGSSNSNHPDDNRQDGGS